jgi:Flp pilus assembly protein TadD
MGRSLSPVTSSLAKAGDQASAKPLIHADGLDYSIERRDGRIFHQETRRDSTGRLVARAEAEVSFVVGSGRQGLGYLIERDGFLFQSPISWYVRSQRYDLAPGYEKQNTHFDRPIVSTCLYCHANRVEPVAGAVNRYERPIFRGHAIGCERCHGPGELHVRRPTMVDGRDITIVNPGELEPSLREAVCEQCHLMGRRRVVKLDRRDDDYRPGLPFYRFWTVFEPPAGPPADKFVGQVEQMHESHCFQSSEGRLGCISCHDPHRLTSPDERVAFFRGRCMECHGAGSCRLPEAVRVNRRGADDCAGCHMPRLRTSDVVHAATTNHRIPRVPDAEGPSPASAPLGRTAGPLLAPFHGEQMDELARTETQRDLALALAQAGPEGAAAALPLFEACLAARPDDVAAWEAKGRVLGQLGRPQEGLAAVRIALNRAPHRESAVVAAAELAAKARQHQDAIAYWRRAIAANSWRSDYRAELAAQCFQARDWRGAADACRDALRLNPTDITVRTLLVRSLLRLRENDAARREIQDLLDFDPPNREELLRWLAPISKTSL